jgi:Ca-activated chloride channel family protein
MNSHSLKALVLCVSLLMGLTLVRAQQQTSNGRSQPDGQNYKPNAPQSGESGQAQTLLRESTSLVNLTVTVTDKQNRFMPGLGREHFEVFEDKVKQNIDFFANADTPLSIGIIFDVSESMWDKLNRARAALGAFIQTSHHDDDYFLVTFNHRPSLTAEYGNGETVMSKLTGVTARGQTALFDAIWLGLAEAPRGRHAKRALLIISDGEDNSSRHTYNELVPLLREANVQIYCIGITDQFSLYSIIEEPFDTIGRWILSDITKLTGGKAFFPRKPSELEDVITRIALELRSQYSIGYSPTNQERNGKWRKVKVRLKPPSGMPSLSVRFKEGYYALP